MTKIIGFNLENIQNFRTSIFCSASRSELNCCRRWRHSSRLHRRRRPSAENKVDSSRTGISSRGSPPRSAKLQSRFRKRITSDPRSSVSGRNVLLHVDQLDRFSQFFYSVGRSRVAGDHGQTEIWNDSSLWRNPHSGMPGNRKSGSGIAVDARERSDSSTSGRQNRLWLGSDWPWLSKDPKCEDFIDLRLHGRQRCRSRHGSSLHHRGEFLEENLPRTSNLRRAIERAVNPSVAGSRNFVDLDQSLLEVGAGLVLPSPRSSCWGRRSGRLLHFVSAECRKSSRIYFDHGSACCSHKVCYTC